jgi:hypothetical protein
VWAQRGGAARALYFVFFHLPDDTSTPRRRATCTRVTLYLHVRRSANCVDAPHSYSPYDAVVLTVSRALDR